MPKVHAYGKVRASDGLVFTPWVTGTEPALVAFTSHRLQLCHTTPLFRDTTVLPALPWMISQDNDNVLYLIIQLFLLRDCGIL